MSSLSVLAFFLSRTGLSDMVLVVLLWLSGFAQRSREGQIGEQLVFRPYVWEQLKRQLQRQRQRFKYRAILQLVLCWG